MDAYSDSQRARCGETWYKARRITSIVGETLLRCRVGIAIAYSTIARTEGESYSSSTYGTNQFKFLVCTGHLRAELSESVADALCERERNWYQEVNRAYASHSGRAHQFVHHLRNSYCMM